MSVACSNGPGKHQRTRQASEDHASTRGPGRHPMTWQASKDQASTHGPGKPPRTTQAPEDQASTNAPGKHPRLLYHPPSEWLFLLLFPEPHMYDSQPVDLDPLTSTCHTRREQIEVRELRRSLFGACFGWAWVLTFIIERPGEGIFSVR